MDHKMKKMDQNNNHSSKRLDRPDVIRKKRKPLMEKRRRARINASLEQLKKLVLDATRRDSARYSKLEKADILELTVKHIKEVSPGVHQDPRIFAKLHDGYGECVSEVNRCLSSFEGVTPELHARLMGHLSTCLQRRVPAMGAVPGLPPQMQTPPYSSGLALAHQQEMAFHQAVSSGAIPRATALQSLPGAAFEQARNLNCATSALSPTTPSFDARTFHNALMQAQANSDATERAQSMERLINSANGHNAAQFMKQLSKLHSMKHEPGVKMEAGLEGLFLRQRMLALEHGENVWRPW